MNNKKNGKIIAGKIMGFHPTFHEPINQNYHGGKSFMPYREKRIYSGNVLEVEIYPISKTERNMSRKKKNKESTEKQKNLNDKNAKKHLVRLINTNFTDDDIAGHYSYDEDHLPKTEEEAKRIFNNYIKRISYYRARDGLSKLKYIAVTEYHNPDTGDKRKKVRMNHHIVMSGVETDIGKYRRFCEKLWGRGRANCDSLQSNKYGYEGLARYITKDPKGAKRWSQSKNIKQPTIKINDYKFSKKKTEQLAMFLEDRELFEKLYPGYTYTECKANVNDVTASPQVYLKMRKTKEGKEISK